MSVSIKKLITVVIMIASCLSTSQLYSEEKQDDQRLLQLAEWMQGSFNSSAQAAQDQDFFNIHLHMKRMWQDQEDSIWLYVEQAADGYLDRPYRQRVYELKQLTDNTFASVVYTFDEPLNHAGAWKKDSPLNELSPESLTIRKGCAVYLEWVETKQVFSGATDTNKCESNLRGASYATSEVVIHKDKVVSWDRGYDADNQQVWGAEKGGYIFIKQ